MINWSGAYKTNLTPITKCIKKVIRIITYQNKYQHTKELFQDMEILPFHLQVKHKRAAFMWKLYNGYIPKPVSDLFCKNIYNPNRFNLPPSATTMNGRLFTYANVRVWNNEVPLKFKSITNYKNFNNKYKEYLLTNL